MTLEFFMEVMKEVEENYGASHYTGEFKAKLFEEVISVDPLYFREEIRSHLRYYNDTKDRPKKAAFAKIKRDFEAMKTNELAAIKRRIPAEKNKGTLDFKGHSSFEELAKANFKPKV